MSASNRIIRKPGFKIRWLALILVLLALIYPLFIERYIVQVNHYRIVVPNLPKSFDKIKIVQVADLHYGALMPKSFIKNIIDRVNALNADVIVCTGDYVHEFKSANQIDEIWPLLSKLRAPLGVYSVLGNHDHWADPARSTHWLKVSGQDLSHKRVCLKRHGDKLWLAGAGDFYEDNRSIDPVLQGIPEKDCRIVLAHNPDTANTPYSRRVDLFISGHTHGGQVVIPFSGPPILPVKNKDFTSGLKESYRGVKVFISKGIGWAIFPVRFNCLPEIAVLELVRE